MSRKWKLFGFKRLRAILKSIKEGWDVYIPGWEGLSPVDPDSSIVVKTANQVDMLVANNSYILLSDLITLSGDWEVSWIRENVGTAFILGNPTTFNFRLVQSSTEVSIFSGTGTGSVITHASLGNSIYKVKRNSSNNTFQLFENGVFIGDTPIGLNTSDFAINQIGRLSGSSYSNLNIRYLNINGQHEYEFTEGVGTQVRDTIGSNHGTFATDNVDPLLIPTWSLGKDTPFNLLKSPETLGYNVYDEFNGVDTNIVLPTPIAPPTNVKLEFIFGASEQSLFYLEGSASGDSGLCITQSRTAGNVHLQYRTTGAVFQFLSWSGLSVGDKITFEAVMDYVVPLNTIATVNEQVPDGVLAGRYTIGAGFTIGNRTADYWYTGVIINLFLDGVNYNTFNNWNNGVKSGTFGIQASNETSEGSGVDGYGTLIDDPTQTVTINPLMTQTALMSHSNYDYFGDGTVNIKQTPFQLGYIEIKALVVNESFAFGTGGESTNGGLLIQDVVGVWRFWIYTGGVRTIHMSSTPITNGVHVIRFELDTANTYGALYIDGVLSIETSALNAGTYDQDDYFVSATSTVLSSFIDGVTMSVDINGTLYTPFNDWNGGTRTGTFLKYTSPKLESVFVNLQNFVLWSEDQSNASWTKSNVVVVNQTGNIYRVSRPASGLTSDGITPTAVALTANNVYVASFKVSPFDVPIGSITNFGDISEAFIGIEWDSLTIIENSPSGRVLGSSINLVNGMYEVEFTFIPSIGTYSLSIEVDAAVPTYKTQIDVSEFQLREYAAWNKYVKTEAAAVNIQETITPLNDTNTLLQPIDRPVLKDGFNLPGQDDHHVDYGALADRSKTSNDVTGDIIGGSTDFFWISRQDFGEVLGIAADDIYKQYTDTGDETTVNFNAVASTTTSSQIVTDKFVFLAFVTDGLGDSNIYYGDTSTEATSIKNSAVGLAAATALNMWYGNTHTLTTPMNGYLYKPGHYARTLAQDAIRLLQVVTRP